MSPVPGADALDADADARHPRAAPAGAGADGLRGGRRGEPVAHAPHPRPLPRELLPRDGRLGRGAPPGEDGGADARVARAAAAPGRPGPGAPGADPAGRARPARGSPRPSPRCSITASPSLAATWSRSRIRWSSCTPLGQSIVSQREVGIDTESYLVGLRNALRQAPDVIFVGELRDTETVAVALHSAETGHLVVSTLHATNVTTAIERLLNFFQPEVRTSTLLQLSLTLRAVVAQRLVPRGDGKGRAAAMEIMLVTPRIQALIRRGELETDPAGDRGGHERGAPDLRPGPARPLPAEGHRPGRRAPLRRQPEQPPAPHEGDPLGRPGITGRHGRPSASRRTGRSRSASIAWPCSSGWSRS